MKGFSSPPFRLREIDVNETYVVHDRTKISFFLSHIHKYSLKQCHCIKIDIMKSRNFSPYSTSNTFVITTSTFFSRLQLKLNCFSLILHTNLIKSLWKKILASLHLLLILLPHAHTISSSINHMELL
jgi:hypothetical protein